MSDEEQDDNPNYLVQQAKEKMQMFEDDYNFAKLESEIKELQYQVKNHETLFKKIQREIESRVTESVFVQIIALINGGIHTDPNIMKLLKSKEGIEEDKDKIKMNAHLFSRKLNQISESLTVLMAHIKRVDGKATAMEMDFNVQLAQKFNHLQLQLDQTKSQQTKEVLQIGQKMELGLFQQNDKLREMETKVNWKLNEFKNKIDDKINEENVIQYLNQAEKRIDKNMREYQIASNIDPKRIDKIEQMIEQNHLRSSNGITECNFILSTIKKDIENTLLKKQYFYEHSLNIQKRMELFNANFTDAFDRVKKCQKLEVQMSVNIQKLLLDTSEALRETKRINTVLVNLKIGQDFQRMLQEMNPSKVLELQNTVDGVQNQQTNIFKQIDIAKKQIQRINAINRIEGVLVPNKARQKLKRQEIHEALNDFLTENQFAHKISVLQRQIRDYKISIDSITLLTRQVARMQKQTDKHSLQYDMRMLQEFIKKELILINNKIDHSKKESFFTNDKSYNLQYRKGLANDSTIIDQQKYRSSSVKRLTILNTKGVSHNILQGNSIKDSKKTTIK